MLTFLLVSIAVCVQAWETTSTPLGGFEHWCHCPLVAASQLSWNDDWVMCMNHVHEHSSVWIFFKRPKEKQKNTIGLLILTTFPLLLKWYTTRRWALSVDLLEDVFCQTQLSANAVLSGSECPRFSTSKMTCTHVLLILKIMVASSCFCLPSASSHCHCVAVNKSILFFFHTHLLLSVLSTRFFSL